MYNMRKLTFLFLLFTLSGLLKLRAESCLVLQLRDGHTLSYVLSEKPIITFEEDKLMLKSDYAGAVFELANIENFHFDDTENGIRALSANERRFSYVEGVITVEGTQDSVILTDLAGHPLHTTRQGQTFTYDLSNQPKGTYLIRIGHESIKLYNK